MRIRDWCSDVCSSDLLEHSCSYRGRSRFFCRSPPCGRPEFFSRDARGSRDVGAKATQSCARAIHTAAMTPQSIVAGNSNSSERSEEHTSELQSLMRISYAVFCLKKKK